MKNLPDIRDLSYQELRTYISSISEKPFRAKQIFEWLYKKEAQDFDHIKNIPSSIKEKLITDFKIFNPQIIDDRVSEDGTRKVLFSLFDDERIETVLIPTKTRATVCVSTQVGCRYGCKFCASGLAGRKRDLSCSEILSQILYFKKISKERPLSHIVFMGVGEPLDNYTNLIRAINIINSKEGVNIAARRITVSTCGLIPGIKKLAKEGKQIELAVSLHGYNNEVRKLLMPVNKKYPIKELMNACKEYISTTKRQITFEYVLIKDVTLTEKAAKELAGLLRGMLCKVNLIPYNPVSEFDYNAPSKKEVELFKNRLTDFGVHCIVRRPRGEDVSAACGQLRHSSS